MTAYTVANRAIGKAITLVAAQVDTVAFSATSIRLLEVVNPGTNIADVWYTIDGTTPTVGGDNCYYAPVGSVDTRQNVPIVGGGALIKVISSGTPTIRVQRCDIDRVQVSN